MLNISMLLHSSHNMIIYSNSQFTSGFLKTGPVLIEKQLRNQAEMGTFCIG